MQSKSERYAQGGVDKILHVISDKYPGSEEKPSLPLC